MATLVEMGWEGRPAMLSRQFDCLCYSAFDLAEGLQGLLCSLAWVGVPLVDECA